MGDLDCVDACSFLAPSHCFDDVVNGTGSSAGCCGGDAGPYRLDTRSPGCESCRYSGTQYDWLCAKCHPSSSCNPLDRVARDDAICQAHACKDGCLNVNTGVCTHTLEEHKCVRDLDSVWCLACSRELWDICYVG